MLTARSIVFLFILLGCLTQATPYAQRSLNIASKTASVNEEDESKDVNDSPKESKDGGTAVKDSSAGGSSPYEIPSSASDDTETPADKSDSNASSGRSKKDTTSNHTTIIPGQQDTSYVNTSVSQWDITNKTMIATNHSISNSTGFLPKERPQSTGWTQTCLGIFLGLAVLLFGLTAFQNYRKRRHYEDAPEMHSLVV